MGCWCAGSGRGRWWAGWVVVGVAVVLPGLAGSWATLAAAELLLGLAVGVLDVSMNGAGVQLEHEAETPLLSGLHAGWSGGVLLGAGLARWRSASAWPSTSTSWWSACSWWRPPGPSSDRRPTGGSSRGVRFLDLLPRRIRAARPARRGRLAALAAIGGCVFLAEGALLDWAGVLVREDLDGGKLLGALAVTGVLAGGLGGRLAGDRLAAAWGSARLVRISVAVATVALALSLLSPVAFPVPLLLVVVGAGLAPAVPLAFAAAGRLRASTASPWSPPPATAPTSAAPASSAAWPTPPPSAGPSSSPSPSSPS